MTYKYDKDSLKENLTIEEVADLVAELGGEPVLHDDVLVCKTICHNPIGSDASYKLYYYANTHLFHCYTGCGDASFDIYELVLKVNKLAGNVNFSLTKAIIFVARYFGYSEKTFEFEEDEQTSADWKLIDIYKRKHQEKNQKQIVQLKHYDDKILKYLPCPHIPSWEQEGIKYSIIKDRGIKYDPISSGIVIPHYDIDGNLVGIRERTTIEEKEQYGKYRPAIINGQQYNSPLGFNLYNLNNSKDMIKAMKIAIIGEGEKFCLQYASFFGEESDLSVACCGSNIVNYQIKLLLSLGVKEIVIGLDKQFKSIGDEEWKKWTSKLYNIYNKYGQYVNISYLFDITDDLLGYKQSPTDAGKDTFIKLFKNRVRIE